MTSTLVSPCIGLRENFQQQELLNQTLSPTSFDLQISELLSQVRETSVADQISLPTASLFSSANHVSRPPITRRHSSSTYNSTTKTSQPQISSLSENSPYLCSIVGSSLEVLPEERFRNRAFSEGSAAFNVDSAQEQVVQQQQQQQQSVTSRYKTELCRQFEESGKCKYGDKCQFAHGKAELRHMVRHPKYKTELCRTYHSSGICPYGPRCHFIHNPDEPNVIIQKQLSVPPSSLGRDNCDRPINLQLGFQSRIGNTFSYSPPLKSPLEPAAFLFGGSEALVSPRSPIEKVGNQFVNFPRTPLSPSVLASGLIENRRNSPPTTKFEFPQLSELCKHDDRVFCGSLTSSDSDRESSTGSPPGFGAAAPSQQRLPIFRCLSQSEHKGV